ncbi:MAG: vWA domain-containing protein [Acidobacteriota bacterium]
MKISTALIALAIAVLSTTVTTPEAKAEEPRRAVDLVICLDVSGSMEPLLDAVRARVWDIVAELAGMEPLPELRVGVLTFGSDRAKAADGYVLIESDLSADLDTVYARLMALQTGGSEEHVGRVLDAALDKMSWASEWDALRIIFVAGNESADQGLEEVDFRDVAERAQRADILINALYAGERGLAIKEGWPEIARRGLGNFSAINPGAMTQVPTPQDDALLELDQRLNATYIPYGPRGHEGLANQVAQDSNASSLGIQSCSSRIVAKGGALYNNASWDLVDAALADDFRWSLIHERDLPAAMRAMSPEQRVAYVDAKRTEREAVQRLIQDVSAEREEYLRGALAELDPQGLGNAMRASIRAQAQARGFVARSDA